MWKHNRPNLLLGLLYLDTKAAIEPGQLSRWCATYNLCNDSSLRLLKRIAFEIRPGISSYVPRWNFTLYVLCIFVWLWSSYLNQSILVYWVQSTSCLSSQAPENNCCNSFNWVEKPEQFVHYDEQQCLGILTCKKYSLAHLVSPKLEEQFFLGLAWQRYMYRIQESHWTIAELLNTYALEGKKSFRT